VQIKILKAACIAELEKELKVLLSDGWKLDGEISVTLIPYQETVRGFSHNPETTLNKWRRLYIRLLLDSYSPTISITGNMAGKDIDMTTETQNQDEAEKRGGHDVRVDALVMPDTRECGKCGWVGNVKDTHCRSENRMYEDAPDDYWTVLVYECPVCSSQVAKA